MEMNSKNMLYSKVDAYIQEAIRDGKLCTFGASNMLREFLNFTKLEIFPYVYDNDINKYGNIIGNCSVKLGKDIVTDVPINTWILVTSNYVEEIFTQLTKLGYNKLLSLRMIKSVCEAGMPINDIDITQCMLEATNCCNARCTFCINPNMKRKKQHMSQSIFDKVLERLVQENISPQIFKLHCSGEPLLDNDLFNKMRKIKKTFITSEVGYTTNFSLANDKIINRIFEEKQDFITISLNAVNPNDYKSIMGLDYDMTMSNLSKFLKLKEKLGSRIKVKISAVAGESEDDLIKKLKKEYEGIDDVSVRIMKKGKWLSQNNNIVEYVDNSKRIKEICPNLYKEICILSDGRYGVCCFDAEGELGDINVFNTGIKDSIEAKKYLRDIFLKGEIPVRCNGCSFI